MILSYKLRMAARILLEIPSTIHNFHMMRIDPKAKISWSITMMGLLPSITMLRMTKAAICTTTKVYMIRADLKWLFTYIVPFVFIGWLWVFWIDPKVVTSGSISMECSLVTIALVLLDTIVMSWQQDMIVTNSRCPKVPLRSNNCFMIGVNPKLVSPRRISMMCWLQIISFSVTKAFVLFAMDDHFMSGAHLFDTLSVVPWILKMIKIYPEVVISSRISMVS